MVAFKVEEELADLLNQLPNKSAFIRKAIATQLSAAALVFCPLCKGHGVVNRDVHDYFAPLIEQRRLSCDGCGGDLVLPDADAELRPEDRVRLEQFFAGGPLYCGSCYHAAPPCGEC